MVPVENHLEQYLNGCDAEQAGIAVRDTAFRLSRLLDPVDAAAVSRFRLWVDEAEARAMRARADCLPRSIAWIRPCGRSRPPGRDWEAGGSRAFHSVTGI